ncbi:kinase-like protein, partial [Coprinopsis marcescibilis]
REAVMWSRLNHPNVLPFLGVYFWRPNPSSDLERVSLLSPWMERGNVLEFLERYPSADKTSLVRLTLPNGLHHLHSLNPPVVHGDLKGNNILVTSAGTACLADFGLSKLVVDSAGQNSPVSHSCLGGNELFCAPEILGESSALQVEPTASSDVYSFGCVGYQIFTGRPRFAHITAIWPRLHAAKKNRPIPQPTNMPSMLWKFTQECWAPGSGSRPCTADLI